MDISARFHVGTIGKHISASTADYNRLHNSIIKVAENYRSHRILCFQGHLL